MHKKEFFKFFKKERWTLEEILPLVLEFLNEKHPGKFKSDDVVICLTSGRFNVIPTLIRFYKEKLEISEKEITDEFCKVSLYTKTSELIKIL